MTLDKKCAVFFFCCDRDRDPCAYAVYDIVRSADGVISTDARFDDYPILMRENEGGERLIYVRTNEVVSNDYDRYVRRMADAFSGIGWAAVVNWHEGNKAPDRVLTVHSTGDVTSGIYAPTDPGVFANLVRLTEASRKNRGLDDFQTWIEATHWSGIVYGGSPSRITDFPRPIFDLEIGSSPASWENPLAAHVLADVCLGASVVVQPLESFIFCGGMHFEENSTRATLDAGFAPAHVLPNHWLDEGKYDRDGFKKMEACLASSSVRSSHLVVHKGLSSSLRVSLTAIGARLGMNVLSHRQFRTMHPGMTANEMVPKKGE